MRYIGPKNRIARREGVDLGLKTPGSKSHARLLRKLSIPPGQHGVKRRKKYSERGMQLREKQKLRALFAVSEKQLKRYYRKSKEKTGNTALYLSQYLERRLDNVVYRLGLAPTRSAARQLIVHRHFLVNKKPISIPSYQVRVNDVINFAKDKSIKIPAVEKQLANQDIIIPKWLERKGNVGKVVGEPSSEDIEKQINLRLIVEYYSR